jgi:hypothetical protein
MFFDLHPKGKPFHLHLHFQVKVEASIQITVFDKQTGRVYAQRRVKLSSPKILRIKLPITPDILTCHVEAVHPQDENKFLLEEIKVSLDTKCPVDLDEKDVDFIRFAKWFAVNIEVLEAGQKGTIYQSEGFTILLLDKLLESNIELTTPARIARDSGVIEISKSAIMTYTVPMLFVVLLHEYAHKFKNPDYEKEVANELTADIIACHIALNLGFDASEVEKCYRTIFSNKQTKLNQQRMKAIVEFIRIFNQSEVKRCKVQKS